MLRHYFRTAKLWSREGETNLRSAELEVTSCATDVRPSRRCARTGNFHNPARYLRLCYDLFRRVVEQAQEQSLNLGT
jgi:ribosomal protein S14